jgi:hypothetical protein
MFFRNRPQARLHLIFTMDQTTKNAAVKVNKYREDGEEAIKRTSKVVPMDSGRGNKSADGDANTSRPGSHANYPSPEPAPRSKDEE